MSRSPWLVRRGYGSPISASACLIDRTASSTVRYHTWGPLGLRAPVWYCLEKLLRIGNRYRYEMIRGGKGHVSTELGSLCPVPIVIGGLTRRESLRDVIIRSAEAIVETSLLGAVRNLYGSSCVCETSTWASKTESIRYREWEGRS